MGKTGVFPGIYVQLAALVVGKWSDVDSGRFHPSTFLVRSWMSLEAGLGAAVRPVGTSP